MISALDRSHKRLANATKLYGGGRLTTSMFTCSVSQFNMFLMVRNKFADETSLLRNATTILRESLPATWQVGAAPEADDRGFDATLTVTNASGVGAKFLVEAKTKGSQSVRTAVDRLRVMAASDPGFPLLFVTEYASPPLRRALEDARISYLDTTGWAYLDSTDPPLFVRLTGARRPPQPRENAATARLNGPAASRAIRCLLEKDPPLGIRELATISFSSPAAVSKLMPTLTDAGAVERSADGTIIGIRRRTLLDRWTADYSFVNSNSVVLDYIAPRGLDRTLQQLEGQPGIVVTASAAAREFLPKDTTSVIPLSLLALYCDDITGTAQNLGLIRADRSSANVMLTTPRDRKLLQNNNISPDGPSIAPVGQVLADLLTIPRSRLAQEAEQLIDVLADNDPTWRE